MKHSTGIDIVQYHPIFDHCWIAVSQYGAPMGAFKLKTQAEQYVIKFYSDRPELLNPIA